MFSNTYGFEDDEAGRDKVLGDFRDMFFKGGGEIYGADFHVWGWGWSGWGGRIGWS